MSNGQLPPPPDLTMIIQIALHDIHLMRGLVKNKKNPAEIREVLAKRWIAANSDVCDQLSDKLQNGHRTIFPEDLVGLYDCFAGTCGCDDPYEPPMRKKAPVWD